MEFDDSELESKLVWIWGSPRTGSTWLLEMLCHPLKTDPDSAVGFRWRDEWDGEASALPVNEFMLGSHLVAAKGVAELDNGIVLPDSLNFFYGAFSSYAFSSAYEDVWRPEARRFALVRLYAVIARAREAGLRFASETPLMVIKEVNSSHGADVVMSLFPRSKMIFLVRDGRDVLDSLLDANRGGGWFSRPGDGGGAFETEEERRAFVRNTCMHWTARTAICAKAFDEHDPALRREVRYEDLLADTEANLTDLAGWLGLPSGPKRIQNVVRAHSFESIPEDRRGPGKIRRSATPGGWRQGLTAEDRRIAQEIMGSQLVRLGYER